MSMQDKLKFNPTISYGNVIELGLEHRAIKQNRTHALTICFIASFYPKTAHTFWNDALIAVAMISGWVMLQGDVAKAGDLAKKNAQVIEKIIEATRAQQNLLTTLQTTMQLEMSNTRDRQQRIENALDRIAPRSPMNGMRGK